jgi:glycosyltransferase involved in cell wall biosynthesis
MRICFLGDGCHTNTTSWINYLADTLGHEIHIITFGNPTVLSDRIRIYKLGPDKKFFLRYLYFIPKLKRLIATIQPDILIGYRITSYGFMAAATGFHPLVLAAQGQNIAYNNSKIKKFFARYAIGRADLIHAWGEHMANKICEFGGSREKILTLPRGINTDLFKQGSLREKEPDLFKIITTRGLKPDYNFPQILEAVELLSKTNIRFQYTLAGDGPYRETLLEMVDRMGIEKQMVFAGAVVHQKLVSLLSEAHIYVSTVISDGVSASLLEAMSSGVFPIVTDNAANRLWVENGVNGYLIKYGDARDLADKIVLAINDSDLRGRAEAINRKIVDERASVGSNMKLFEETWAGLIKQKETSPTATLKAQ